MFACVFRIYLTKAGTSATTADDYANFRSSNNGGRVDSTAQSSSKFDTMPSDLRGQQIDIVPFMNRTKRSLVMDKLSSQPLSPLPPLPLLPPTIFTTFELENMTYSYDNTTITNYTHNETCVGEPEYCNYTREEYIKMLYDYIFPTTGEWILIGCHSAVFIIGLVSAYTFEFLIRISTFDVSE